MRASRLAFIRQLGFSLQKPDDVLYSALMFQPRIVGGILAIGVLFQSAWIFLALSAVLWWGTFVPTQNAFDAIYNIGVARRRGLPPVPVAPPPRRAAMGQAAALALVIGAALLAKTALVAWIFEGFLIVANLAAIFGDFCAGAHVYNVVRQRRSGSPRTARARTETGY
jgi:Domain of unknown function (DUF4395)